LRTAGELLDERGFAGFTVDEVARRSGVGKATIYKHWSGGFDLAVDAFGDLVTEAVPVADTGDAPADLSGQISRLAAFYASPRGTVVAQLLAAGISRPGGGALLREKFFAKRRRDTVALIDRGKATGQLRPDLNSELAVDLLFGPIVFRLFNGYPPVDAVLAAELAELAMRAVRRDGD
jgi:AcrR family transcriptional regulator